MDNALAIQLFKELREKWLDMMTITNSRMLALERALCGDGALAPLTDGVATVGSAIITGPRVGLIGPITAETGNALMSLLVEVSNGVVDDSVKEALRKHCDKRFGAADLTKLNEAMGRHLVTDFENVKNGKHQLAYNEDGCLKFTHWEG